MPDETRKERLRRLTVEHIATRKALDAHEETAIVGTLRPDGSYEATGHRGITHGWIERCRELQAAADQAATDWLEALRGDALD